jgi:hypothetical protein
MILPLDFICCLLQRVCRPALVVFTFLFAVTWQFNQFALLLQSMALFGLQALNLVEHRKVNSVHCVQRLATCSI